MPNQDYSSEILKTLQRIEEQLILLNEHNTLAKPIRAKRTPTVLRSLDYPWDTAEFLLAWDYWREWKKKTFKFTYKTNESEQQALASLAEESGGDEKTAIAIIKQSVARQWQGFFPLKKYDDKGNKLTDLFAGIDYS